MGKNRWLKILAGSVFALTILLVSSGKVHALSVIDYQIDSTEIQEIVLSARPGMYLHNPCLLILRYYLPDSLHPVLNKTTVKLNWEGWPSGDQILTDGYHVWAEDTLHQLDLKLVGYGKLKLTGLRLRRDSVTIVPVWLLPGRDSATFDYSRPNGGGMKLFPMPTLSAGVVHGRVVDAETSEPIEGVQVSLPDEQVIAMTDDSGRFTLHSSQFGRSCRVIITHSDFDTVDVGLTKLLPETELRMKILLTERPSWWHRLFAKEDRRGMFLVTHSTWGWLEEMQKVSSNRITQIKMREGDQLIKSRDFDANFVVESIDSTGAWVKYDSVAYRCLLDTTAMRPMPLDSLPTGEQRFGRERIGKQKVEFQSNTVDGGDTYGIQWIRTEE